MNTTFLTAIHAQIKTVSAVKTSVYFETAPTTAVFPYVVYSYGGSVTDFDSETYSLNVDIWSKGTDTTTLENLTKSINDALQKYSYVGTGVGFKLFKQSTAMVPDPNELIRRRRLNFDVITYYY
jgi:hypothetical protein